VRRDLVFTMRVAAETSSDAELRALVERGLAELMEGQLYAGKTRQLAAEGGQATVEITAFAQRPHEEPD
jgi:hypothetical protein